MKVQSYRYGGQIAFVAAAMALLPGTASAADWIIARASSSGACNVQEETSRPILGTPIGKFPTRKAACERAKALKSSDASDTGKCYAYTRGAEQACRQDNVSL